MEFHEPRKAAVSIAVQLDLEHVECLEALLGVFEMGSAAVVAVAVAVVVEGEVVVEIELDAAMESALPDLRMNVWIVHTHQRPRQRQPERQARDLLYPILVCHS